MLLYKRQTGLPIDFWMLLGPSSLIALGDIIRIITFSWVLVNNYENSVLLSVFLVANAVAKITAPLVAGALINTRNLRYVLFLSLSVGLISTCIVLILFSEPIFPYILPFLEFMIAAAGMIFIIARQSLLRDILLHEQKDRAVAYLRASNYSTGIVSPVVAGVLLSTNQPVYSLFLNAGVFLFAIIFVFFVQKQKERQLSEMAPYVGLNEKMSFILDFYKDNPKVRNGLLYFALTNFAMSPLGVIVPVFVNKAFGLGPGALGGSEFAIGIGAVIGALCATRVIRWSLSKASGILAVLFTIISVCGYFGENWFYLFVLALFGIGINIAIFGAKIDGLFMKDIPREIYPKIIGIQSMIVGSVFPLGLVVSGMFIKLQDNYIVLPFISAIIAMVGTGLLYSFSRNTSKVKLA